MRLTIYQKIKSSIKKANINNILLYILIIAIFLGFLQPIPAYAAGCSSYDSCTIKQEFYQEQKGGVEDPAFTAIKPQLPVGTTPRNNLGLPFNYRLWHDKGIVIYGNYKSLSLNDFVPATQYYEGGVRRIVKDTGYYKDNKNCKGEYRFHGYDVNGNKYTNVNFVDDLNSGESLANKYWLYFPWNNPLTPTKTRPERIGEYNQAATLGNDPDTQKWINATLSGWEIRGNRGIDGKVGSAPSNQAYNYVYVMSTPSSKLPGEGRMWHRWGDDDKTYYQTFSIPKVEKKKNNVEVSIELLTPLLDMEYVANATPDRDNEKKKVRLKVTATLKDETYYSNNVKKVTNYTRYDIDHWVITLKGSNNEPIKMIGNISRKDNKGWAEFERSFTIAELRDTFSKGYTVSADAHAVYVDKENSFPGNSLYPLNFNKKIIPAAKTIKPPPEPPPVIVDPKPNIPHPWYDIVAYPASDGTDMPKVASREVYIDGVQVDDNLFFSGNYIFGDGKDGLKRIDIYYTSKDGYPAEFTRWVYVYPTKPRAQFSFNGTYKQNRKMTVTDTSNSANDLFVINTYPINNYQWTFKTVEGDGSSRKMRDISQVYKELMYKEPGTYQIELVVTNTLGRKSDPYTLTFHILEDIPAAVICNLNYNVLARNETIRAYAYDVVSTDGDSIESNKVEVYYDSNNDGECEQLIATYNNVIDFPEFTPTKLGNYKFVNTVKEEFGEETLAEFITDADKKVKVVEREFFVDNLIPMTGLYVDIPIVRPEIDLYFMIDKNLDRGKAEWILNNRINIDNSLRLNNILPKVETWDMHTHTYSQYANTSRNTGTTYPSSSLYYSGGGYSGYLSLYSTSDNGSSVDQGGYETRTESKTFNKSWTNTVTTTYNCSGTQTGYSESSPAPSSYSINEDGYSGSIPRGSTSGPNNTVNTYCTAHNGAHRIKWTRSFTAYYSGTLSKTVQVWVPKWVWVSNYTGYYSGTIYKSVRQPYTDPFRNTSYKYVIYVSDGNVSELPDLQMVISKADSKLILIGQDSIKSQIPHEYFILNNGRPVEELVNEALSYISENNQSIERLYVLAGKETFALQTSDYDEEKDPLVEKKVQYVQDVNYFDNPTGKETYAAYSYSDNANWIDTIVNRFDKVGKFSIFRRVKDLPTTDPRFSMFSKYSGVSELQIIAHRKPIALATLDWDFDNSRGVYLTRWVDKSYDLDHQFRREDKGIVDRKIMFRKNRGEWLYYIPDELSPGTYELNYYVKDPEGVWSDPFTMNFTLQTAPSVQFDAKLRTLEPGFILSSIPASEYLEVYDIWTRYPYNVKLEMALYNGTTRVSPLQAINYSTAAGRKTGNDILWNNINYRIPDTLRDGIYTFKISAVDVNNESIRREKSFSVKVETPVNLIPDMPVQVSAGSTCDIGAGTSKYVNATQVILYAGTGYQTSILMTGSVSGKFKNWAAVHSVPSNIPDGIYTARFTAVTANGNQEVISVNYEVQSLKINGVTIEGYWNHWRGQKNIFGEQLTNEPHRFLSLERVKINIDTTGYADKIEIRFSPELQAMQFTDKYGNLYDYKNDFNLSYAYFPKIITLDSTKKDNSVYWEYVLPLANSTKTWENERIGQPYLMEVTAWRGAKSAKYIINDIDITGNIYDLTYIQPVD